MKRQCSFVYEVVVATSPVTLITLQMQHNIQKETLSCIPLLNLINTQSTSNLISDQEEEMENRL